MKSPTKNLFGGVEELHTREYLPKSSAQMMGRRERSKFWSESSKNASSRCRTRVLGKKGRERKKTHLKMGPVGPRWPGGLPTGPLVGPLVSPRCLWVTPGMEIFILYFLEFSENFTVEKISEF